LKIRGLGQPKRKAISDVKEVQSNEILPILFLWDCMKLGQKKQ